MQRITIQTENYLGQGRSKRKSIGGGGGGSSGTTLLGGSGGMPARTFLKLGSLKRIS